MEAQSLELSVIDAFTDEAFSGNPAGVVLQASGLNEGQMQRIAREVNASETAFLVGGDAGLFKVRFFTPTQEVDFCGHATVAIASARSWSRANPFSCDCRCRPGRCRSSFGLTRSVGSR